MIKRQFWGCQFCYCRCAGANAGAYEQVTELKYVGEGRGVSVFLDPPQMQTSTVAAGVWWGQGSIHKEVVTEAKPAVPWVWCYLAYLALPPEFRL